MTYVEKECQKVLSDIGYRVTKIPEDGVRKVYDFEASRDWELIAIEVKAKEDDRNVQLELMRKGETEIFSSDASKNGRFKLRFEDAAAQLSAASPNAFKMVWYSLLEARDFELSMEQLDYLLYGTQQIFGGGGIRNCYLYHESFFEREQWLHGVMIRAPKGFVLWPNPFAEQASEFTMTKIYQEALAGDFIWRPLDKVEEHGQYMMSSKIDRTNDAIRLNYLIATYKLGQVLALNMGHHSGYFSVPRIELEAA